MNVKLIVGLGNPGKQYENTRHNVGFWAIDDMSATWNIPMTKEKWKAGVGEGLFQGEKVVLVKPLTYMNLSGESVRMALDWLKIDLKDFIVLYDDLDLPVGQLRLRRKGSAGGHNGIKSLIQHLGTDEFNRIKIGIGRPTTPQPTANYVLSAFQAEEVEQMNQAVERSRSAVETWRKLGFAQAMNEYNRMDKE